MTDEAIICFICMRDYTKEFQHKVSGISLFFCDEHYPKEWDTVEADGQ